MRVNEIFSAFCRGDGRGRAHLALASLCVALGCGPGVDERDHGAAGGAGEGGSSGSTTMVPEEASTTGPSEDASPFFGVFHYEHGYFGGHFVSDSTIPPWASLVNVEIRPDGTAGLFMEMCIPLFDMGPIEIEWLWEMGQDGWLELSPAPGEPSLRFMGLSELESLRAYLDDPCTMRFEVDGELSERYFRPGRACWGNRCDPPWTIYLDYCPGEEPKVCE